MITSKQQSVLNSIHDLVHSLNRQPTLAEIGTKMGLRESGIHKHVHNLIASGYLLESSGKEAYLLSDDIESVTSLPLLGVIAAGKPIEAIPDVQSIDLAAEFCQSGRYVLRIAGDSMFEAGILDGDYVVIREQAMAERGEIVVALIDGSVNGHEATLKYFHPQTDSFSFAADGSSLANGSIELRPANSAMESFFYPADEVTIQGVVVGSFRSYSVSGS